ncbi:MAG: methyltransferase domain-containing protein [Hormoscilla sp.]
MNQTISEEIKEFYDASSGLWERVWGEHMHHGYYGESGRERKDRRQAQIELMAELLRWAGVRQADRILDVGCGIGGSSLYLTEKFNAQVTGITLSPVQASRATQRAGAAAQSDRTQFMVADALNMPFAANSFDLVWSLESGEHMPDKEKFLAECYRVLQPGGTLLLATWCHRPTKKPGWPLTADEQKHLEEIYRVYCLPYVIGLPEYQAIAHSVGFEGIRIRDWSSAVAPFWDEVIFSAMNPDAILDLLGCGWQTIVAALSLPLMVSGYRRGLIRYGLLSARKSGS